MEGESPPRKKGRIETEDDRRQAVGDALAAADVDPRRIAKAMGSPKSREAFRRRLDPAALESLAATLSLDLDLPLDLVNAALSRVEGDLDPVPLVLGARFDYGRPGVPMLEFVDAFEVSPMATIEEVVKEVQVEAALVWTIGWGVGSSSSGDAFARLSDADRAEQIDVALYSEATSPDDAGSIDYWTQTLRLWDSRRRPKPGFAISGNSKLLTYAGSGLASPSVEPM